MIIKKCDVCKNETDALYDREVTTHIDTISGNTCYKKEKLHLCRTCMGSIKNTVDACELSWYNDNIKEDDVTPSNDTAVDNDNQSNETQDNNNEQNSGPTEGPTVGE